MDYPENPHWEHLKQIARQITEEFSDAVFIGGVATYCHALSLGAEFQESSHDADLYLSMAGKSELRDRYEVRRSTNPQLVKDSVLVEGEDLDLYVEHQHNLGVPYAAAYAHSKVIDGVRVAAIEHLLVLKLDAARDRKGTGKGEKDVRDIVKLVAILETPSKELLEPFYLKERDETLRAICSRRDLPQLLGLQAFDGSRFKQKIDSRVKEINKTWGQQRGYSREH